MNGIFSVKSDVYSFGVLLLEIISGKKNTVFSSSGALSLIELVCYYVTDLNIKYLLNFLLTHKDILNI